jgi:hypothetical protein
MSSGGAAVSITVVASSSVGAPKPLLRSLKEMEVNVTPSGMPVAGKSLRVSSSAVIAAGVLAVSV